MKTIFIDEITEHSFTLKCIPKTDASQSIESIEVHLETAYYMVQQVTDMIFLSFGLMEQLRLQENHYLKMMKKDLDF